MFLFKYLCIAWVLIHSCDSFSLLRHGTAALGGFSFGKRKKDSHGSSERRSEVATSSIGGSASREATKFMGYVALVSHATCSVEVGGFMIGIKARGNWRILASLLSGLDIENSFLCASRFS